MGPVQLYILAPEPPDAVINIFPLLIPKHAACTLSSTTVNAAAGWLTVLVIKSTQPFASFAPITYTPAGKPINTLLG